MMEQTGLIRKPALVAWRAFSFNLNVNQTKGRGTLLGAPGLTTSGKDATRGS